MNIEDLKKPLSIFDIEFRIQSINKGGYATILAYKDARVDMNILDSVCGPLNWKREHLNNNANCIVSIWDESKKQWISKEDTGTESMTEKAKGLASDSFKRAGFNWGIGRELYDYPIIQVKLTICTKGPDGKYKNDGEYYLDSTGKAKATWNLKIKSWLWFSQFTEDKLTYLACKDSNKNPRFKFGEHVEPKK